jgi:excinuclease ABC subunit C
MPIIGIAKRLEEIYFPGDQYPIHLDKKSESLMLLQRIRDEAHRFAITFHRQVRSKKALNSQLTDIEGIGALTAQKLLKEFKSVKKIQMASEEDIAAVIGAAKAKALLAELAKNKASN